MVSWKDFLAQCYPDLSNVNGINVKEQEANFVAAEAEFNSLDARVRELDAANKVLRQEEKQIRAEIQATLPLDGFLDQLKPENRYSLIEGVLTFTVVLDQKASFVIPEGDLKDRLVSNNQLSETNRMEMVQRWKRMDALSDTKVDIYETLVGLTQIYNVILPRLMTQPSPFHRRIFLLTPERLYECATDLLGNIYHYQINPSCIDDISAEYLLQEDGKPTFLAVTPTSLLENIDVIQSVSMRIRIAYAESSRFKQAKGTYLGKDRVLRA